MRIKKHSEVGVFSWSNVQDHAKGQVKGTSPGLALLASSNGSVASAPGSLVSDRYSIQHIVGYHKLIQTHTNYGSLRSLDVSCEFYEHLGRCLWLINHHSLWMPIP